MKLLLVASNPVQTCASRLPSPHEIFSESPAARLREQLKQAHGFDAIILADGAAVLPDDGLTAGSIPLIIPRVHNGAALLLGGADAYRALFARCDGALCFVSSGWDAPEFAAASGDCASLCYLADTQCGAADESLSARALAAKNGWDFFSAEIDPDLLARLLRGDWDADDITVVRCGETVRPSFRHDLLTLD